ncbi:hypothetical protein B0G77_6923 [Paraburkholderia sp. BL10I2N1]|nr:hypothetical protein B0G77_6923 [Paraburkholderia sp. BL10I2N1]
MSAGRVRPLSNLRSRTHQRFANVVSILLWPLASLDDSVAWQTWQAAGDDAERFTAGMDFDSRTGASDFHVCFMKSLGLMPHWP